MENLVKFKHSGNLEVFHYLLNKFSPKRIPFTYEGMIARTQLPILDHNCGVSRKQILDEQGVGKINTQYTKVTAHYVAKKVMEPKDKNYIKEIIDEVKSSE